MIFAKMVGKSGRHLIILMGIDCTNTKHNQTLQADNLTAAQNAAKTTTHAAVKPPLS